eukprot:CAMPEP_0194058746 /NCGR_PEP_ID=MMETSP0009_2-20130614/67120_1 /TAXON_ID=210454 /ORGANISM="Grammatophora oceanica, Strain CCMP 410" /LENGTH=204 /DNA_ID=CAMNT_0038709029 /DNA_START=73 /DNA_END=687 /DNA_ORIENTATION=+
MAKSTTATIGGPRSCFVRYDTLIKAIDKTLVKSRERFDSRKTVDTCYGEDASFLGGADLLTRVMDGMMEKVQTSVKDDMNKALEKNGVKAKLEGVESIMNKIRKEKEAADSAEVADQESTAKALSLARRPDGVSPDDVLSFKAYHMLREQHAQLEKEMQRVEEQVKRLQDKLAGGTKSFKEKLRKVEKTGKKVEEIADFCASQT